MIANFLFCATFVLNLGTVLRDLAPTIGFEQRPLKLPLTLFFERPLCSKRHGPQRPGPDNWLQKEVPEVTSNSVCCPTFVLKMGTVPDGLAPTIGFKEKSQNNLKLCFLCDLCAQNARYLEAWPRQSASKSGPQSDLLFCCATFVLKMGTVPGGLAPTIRFEKPTPK